MHRRKNRGYWERKKLKGDVRYFNEVINRGATNNQGLAKKTGKAVKEFVENIYAYREMRNTVVWLGLASILFWGALSLFYLIVHAISPFTFSDISCPAILTGISIGLFISCAGFFIISGFLMIPGLLSLIYITNSCLFSSISCSATLTGISIGSFVNSLVLTLFFVFYSLCAKRPKPK